MILGSVVVLDRVGDGRGRPCDVLALGHVQVVVAEDSLLATLDGLVAHHDIGSLSS